MPSAMPPLRWPALDAQEAAINGRPGRRPPADRCRFSTGTRREKLEAEVHAAAAQAARSSGKQPPPTAPNSSGSRAALKALEPAVRESPSPTVLAESRRAPACRTSIVANKALASKAERIQSAFVEIRGLAEGLGNPNVARPVYLINEKLHERIRVASARPAPDAAANHRASWAAFAQELRRDPIAEFES